MELGTVCHIIGSNGVQLRRGVDIPEQQLMPQFGQQTNRRWISSSGKLHLHMQLCSLTAKNIAASQLHVGPCPERVGAVQPKLEVEKSTGAELTGFKRTDWVAEEFRNDQGRKTRRADAMKKAMMKSLVATGQVPDINEEEVLRTVTVEGHVSDGACIDLEGDHGDIRRPSIALPSRMSTVRASSLAASSAHDWTLEQVAKKLVEADQKGWATFDPRVRNLIKPQVKAPELKSSSPACPRVLGDGH